MPCKFWFTAPAADIDGGGRNHLRREPQISTTPAARLLYPILSPSLDYPFSQFRPSFLPAKSLLPPLELYSPVINETLKRLVSGGKSVQLIRNEQTSVTFLHKSIAIWEKSPKYATERRREPSFNNDKSCPKRNQTAMQTTCSTWGQVRSLSVGVECLHTNRYIEGSDPLCFYTRVYIAKQEINPHFLHLLHLSLVWEV